MLTLSDSREGSEESEFCDDGLIRHSLSLEQSLVLGDTREDLWMGPDISSRSC